MQAINVFENGIGYLSECLNLYLGGVAYLLLYVCGILFVLLKGDDEEKEIFIPGAVLMMVTVYNPIAPLILDKFFDVSSEFYRLFWITPVIVLVPFVISKITSGLKDTHEKIVSAVFVIAVLFLGGSFVYNTGIPFAQNRYKIPDELIEISEMIHEDSGTEYTKAFFEYEYNMEIRQYDPKMLLTIDREEYIYAVNYSYTDEMLNDEATPVNKILAVLVRNQDVDTGAFTDALEATKTRYIVLMKGHFQTNYLKKAGLKLVGESEMHNIFRYDLKEQADYSLIDYSNVEHRFSYRRLK